MPGQNLSPTQQRMLSIAVVRAITSIANNVSQAKVRLFTDTGREITGGRLYDLIHRPFPKTSWRKFCFDVMTFWNTYGEYFISPSDERVSELRLLHPNRIQVWEPRRPRSRGDVSQWKYSWSDGTQEYIRDDFVISDAMFNPDPSEPVRGLSPLETGAVQVSSSYYAGQYNRKFFENSAIPSHILALTGGIPRAQREELERKYFAEQGTYANAHKTFVVSGIEDAKFLSLEQPFQEGAFMEVQKWAYMQVGQLFGVPAVEMGIYDKTRFDTAAEERKQYVESTLAPQADRLSESLQIQLVDRYFAFSDYSTESVRLGSSLSEKFEKARAGRGIGSIVLLIDIDTLPIMGAVKAAQIENAMKFRDTLLMSPQEVADFFKIDIPGGREERQDVYAPQTHRNITHPEKNPDFYMQSHAMAQEAKPSPGSSGGDSAKPKLSADDRARLKALDRAVRELRRLTLESLFSTDAKMWELAVVAQAFGHRLACRVHYDVRQMQKRLRGDALRERIKTYFSEFDTRSHLGLN